MGGFTNNINNKLSVEKEEEEEVLKCFYRTVRAVKIERTSGADFSAAKRFHGRFVVFFLFLFYVHTQVLCP